MKDDDDFVSLQIHPPPPPPPLCCPAFFPLPREFGNFQFSERKRSGNDDVSDGTATRGDTLKQQITSGSSIITRHLITADGCRVWAILRRLS